LSGPGLATSPARSSAASTVDGRRARQLCNLGYLALGILGAVGLFDDFRGELEASAATHWLAEAAIDRWRRAKAFLRDGTDLAVAMAVADAYVHAA